MAHEAIIQIDGQGRATGATAGDAEVLCELSGGTYRAVLTVPKGGRQTKNGLFWTLCGRIAENHPGGYSKDEVGQVLKIECGHSRALRLDGGTYVRVARSIAFDKMTDAAFGEFLDAVLLKAGDAFGHELVAAVLDSLDRAPAPEMAVAA